MYRILEALAAKTKTPKSLDGRLMLRSFSRKFQRKTDLGLHFEVVQSFRSVWTKQTVACHLPFSAFKSVDFYIRAFFLSDSNGKFLPCAHVPRSGGKYLRERTQYWLLSVFLYVLKETYVLQERAQESQPLSSVCVHIGHAS